jgi:hypothetical protein
MASFIARQPNGKICRFSGIIDCPTNWNLTDEEYIELCAEKAREEARIAIKDYIKTFDWVLEEFVPNNMTRKEFDKILREMGYEKEKI